MVKWAGDLKASAKTPSAAIAAIDGPLGGVSSRVSSFVTLLTSGTAVATAFGLAIAAIGFAASAGVLELDRMNIELAKTEAVLKATGAASGKTSLELQEQARSIALATLASTQGIQRGSSKAINIRSN